MGLSSVVFKQGLLIRRKTLSHGFYPGHEQRFVTRNPSDRFMKLHIKSIINKQIFAVRSFFFQAQNCRMAAFIAPSPRDGA
jgi:hypothetical protein